MLSEKGAKSKATKASKRRLALASLPKKRLGLLRLTLAHLQLAVCGSR